MRRLLAGIDATSEWTGRIFGYIIYAGIAVLVYEVVARYFFGAATTWAHGISQRLFAVYYVIGAAYVLRHKAHINMDVVYNLFPVRTRAILDLFTSPLFFAVAWVVLWYGADFAWGSLKILETCTTPFHAPLYPVKLMVPVAGFLLLLQGLAKYSRDLVTAITGRQCEY